MHTAKLFFFLLAICPVVISNDGVSILLFDRCIKFCDSFLVRRNKSQNHMAVDSGQKVCVCGEGYRAFNEPHLFF